MIGNLGLVQRILSYVLLHCIQNILQLTLVINNEWFDNLAHNSLPVFLAEEVSPAFEPNMWDDMFLLRTKATLALHERRPVSSRP